MLIKKLAAVSAVICAALVIFTDLAQKGAALIWICPLLLLGCFVACNVLYALMVFIGCGATISFKKSYKQKPSVFWSHTLEALADWLCAFGRVRVHVSGLEKLPEGRFLMVCNHRSYFDPLVKIPIFKTVGMTYISKPKNFRIPIAGKLMHAYGCLSLNRENNREALTTIKDAAEIISSDRASVCIYPEGTRSCKQELLPFHAGSFKIAHKAGNCPVVVTTLHGTDSVNKNFPLHHTDVYVDVTAVFDSELVKSKKTNELAEAAQKLVQDKYNEFDRKSKEKAEC